MVGDRAVISGSEILHPEDVHQILGQLIGSGAHLDGTLVPGGIIVEQLGIMVSHHGHAGTGRANNGLGGFKKADKVLGGHPGFTPVSCIKSRLPTAGLLRRARKLHSQVPENPYHGLGHFRINSIHQTLDEQGYGL